VKPSNYLSSYPHFINFFSEKEHIGIQDFFVSSQFTYGWMPTILEYKNEKLEDDLVKILPILNDVKNSKTITDEDLNLIKIAMNNSIVGTSKLLHFIAPNKYPIWDSIICRNLTGRDYQTFVNSLERYRLYEKLCEEIAETKQGKMVCGEICKEFDEKLYPISKIRALELVFFRGGIKKIKRKKKLPISKSN